MKFFKISALVLSLVMIFTACGSYVVEVTLDGATKIELSDDEIMVEGKSLSDKIYPGVHIANDIVYYESGKDFTYGEGAESDAHTSEEAAEHTVIHITEAGAYEISGKLSRGQIAVDLGEDAKKNENANVTLILNGVDITCTVAPAIIFYNVYECGEKDEDKAKKDVDTSAAGANVIIADDSINTVNGSYVARIYEPETVILSEDGKSVEDADKLHKYDGALYSKMSMNVNGGKKGTGVLNINAKNEGLDTECHLTINGGTINIFSGNDGINTNEDGVSVTTINGGQLNIKVTGETGEGDGIDSNGWLVINGGGVFASANSDSADSGIDSDMGIHINGGSVIASGNMLDRISSSEQTYVVFNFSKKQIGGEKLTLKYDKDESLYNFTPQNDYTVLIVSTADLKEGMYTLWNGGTQLSHGGVMTGMGGPQGRPEDFQKPDGFEDFKNGEKPENFQRPEGETPPQKPDMPMPEGEMPQPPQMSQEDFIPYQPNGTERSTAFEIKNGANQFSSIY